MNNDEINDLITGLGKEVIETQRAVVALIAITVNHMAPEGAIKHHMPAEAQAEAIQGLLEWATEITARLDLAHLLTSTPSEN